ncbi:hypothetical protein ACP4OV_030247 [Aristida adscensionis]
MASSGDSISSSFSLTWRRRCSGATAATKPLTMFYNGSVAIFHLPQDKAENIMKMAAGGEDDGDGGGRRRHGAGAADRAAELLAKMREEMPIASKRSLQRFFQKRKERLHRP